MDFLSVLNEILILFLLLLSGYAAKKMMVFEDSFIKGVSSFLIKVSLPALIITSMQYSFTPQLLMESGKILLFSLGVYGFSFLVAYLLPFIMKSPKDEMGVYQFMMVFSNVGFMGYPVIKAIFGSEALFYTAIYNLPFNFLLFTLGIYLLKKGGSTQYKIKLKTFLNPGVIAVLIGFSLFLLSARFPAASKLPYPIARSMALLGEMTTPLSMIVIGGLLANTNIRDMIGNWRIYVASILRLIVIPVAVLLMLRPFTSHPFMLGVPVVISAMPAAANTAILSEEYGANSRLASQGVSVSSFLAIITIPIIALMVS